MKNNNNEPQQRGLFNNRTERGEKAEAKLKSNPYDLESWNFLIKESSLKSIDDARNVYELLIDRFPLTGRFWKIYIEHEIKAKNFDKVEKLFQRSLTKVLHIDLWKCYLNYIKETKSNQPSFRETIAKAYDFALEKIGADYLSYSIWNDYVTFLKNVEAVGSYAENQKITAVRKIFQKGVVNPMVNIEQFWKSYIEYENSVNPIIAEKMIADRSREYMNARRVSKEYEAATRGLNRNSPGMPPSADPEQLRQVELWRKYIAWEKSNPLRTEDTTEVVRRVEFAYEQCLLCLGHYPDIWYEYASYLEESAKSNEEKGDSKKYLDDAANVYQRSTSTLMKTNVMLHFAWADFEESRNKKDKATEIYNDLLDVPEIDPTLVFVQFMKFSRRAEGIKTARAIFKRAREDARSGHQIYSAAALMEYYCSKDKNVACKIFELGLKKYPSNQAFILSYLDFLSHLNEENNTRVLFERVLTSGALTPEDSIEIWNKFLEFESNIGDLSSIAKVEKRRAAALEKVAKSDSETAWLVDRYKFLDLYPCTPAELRAIGYTQKGTSTPMMSTTKSVEENIEKTISRPKPNVNQMLPFKPIKDANNPHNILRVSGGIFPPPPIIGHLLSLLPHPTCFKGPFVNVDDLLNLININGHIPTNANAKPPEPEPVTNGKQYFETAIRASANHGSAITAGQERLAKRLMLDDEDDGDNSNSNNSPAFRLHANNYFYLHMKVTNAQLAKNSHPIFSVNFST